MTDFEKKIGYQFKDKALLAQAVTHASAMGEKSYERLEFLGDRILGLVIAQMLFDAFSDEKEGDLAKRLNALVRLETLKKVADVTGLQTMIVTADTKKKSITPSMLADVTEAVIAALYLDGGFDQAKAFVQKYWKEYLHQSLAPPEDEKSKLQEWAQSKGLDLPKYKQVERSGPDHKPFFVVEASLVGYAAQRGEGATKQLAEKAAALALYSHVSE